MIVVITLRPFKTHEGRVNASRDHPPLKTT